MAVRPAIIGVHHPDVGKRLGVYRVLSVLGEGGMSRVYLAEHTRLGRKVALKRLKSPYAERKSAVQRFFAEAKTINRIHHAHIVDVTDFVEADDQVYCVMELLEGQTVARAIELEGVISLRRSLHIAHQITEALSAAHQQGVIHLDIKPANVFLTAHGAYHDYVKLLDFGVAQLLEPNRPDGPAGAATGDSAPEAEDGAEADCGGDPVERVSPDARGPCSGTPIYMSPEQATGAPVDHRSDIYSLGITLYEMLAGRPPFQADGRPGYVYQHQHVQPAPLHRLTNLPHRLPHGCSQIVSGCLAKDPARRYPSAAALRADLVRGARRKGLILRPGKAPQLAAPAANGRRWLRAALAVSVGALMVVAAVLLLMGRWGDRDADARRTGPLAANAHPDAAPPRRVTLALQTSPPKAEVVRIAPNRAVLGLTPLRLTIAPSAEPWTLEVSRRGYARRRVEVVLDRDQGLALDLVPLPPRRPPTAATADAAADAVDPPGAHPGRRPEARRQGAAGRAPPARTPSWRVPPRRPPAMWPPARRPPARRPPARRPPARRPSVMGGGSDQIVDPFGQ
jgi:serine/threonine-protein kinase